MKKIGIIYGSTTGTCESLASQLAESLGVTSSDVHSADKLTDTLVSSYDVLFSALPLGATESYRMTGTMASKF